MNFDEREADNNPRKTMPLKPRHQITLMIAAMVLGALLSFIILVQIDPGNQTHMEKNAKITASALETEGEKAADTTHLPAITFYDAAGKAVTLDDFRGYVVLVNLWATWCPPCVVELPALDTLQAKLHDKGLHVVALSVDREDVEKVAAFLAERKLERLTVYHDRDRQVPQKWTYGGIPASFLLDRTGRIVTKYEGPKVWDQGEIYDHIAALVSLK